MPEETQTSPFEWWATEDLPMREQSRVTHLIDGRATMLTMCRHFVKARSYIYLANWGMSPSISMARGTDQHGAPNAQDKLVAQLQAEGLSDADIAFWLQTPVLSLENVLQYVVKKGVEVKVLLWKCNDLFSHYEPSIAHQQLEQRGISCILDDSAMGILHHPIESLHQKTSVVDGLYAFVGGVDPLVEKAGDFDRWDSSDHQFQNVLRQDPQGRTSHPWHDVHTLIEGPAVADVEHNFRQRWNDVVTRHEMPAALLVPEHTPAPAIEAGTPVQIVRTIPQHTYRFQPPIIRTIAQSYHKATSNIRRFAYIENQYFWLHAFFGIDHDIFGTVSQEMEQNLRNLGAALRNGASIAIVLPDHPNVGRAFTDAGIAHLRAQAPNAVEEGRLQVFCLGTSATIQNREHYRPIYVHAKVMVVDDTWCTIGSGNLNNRGMADDTELNVTTLNPSLPHALRLSLQAEHLGLVQDDDLLAISRFIGKQPQSSDEQAHAQQVLTTLEGTLGDPMTTLHMMHERAWDNLRRYQTNQPLVGHLLPYLSAESARNEGLNFHEEHGWLEAPIH